MLKGGAIFIVISVLHLLQSGRAEPSRAVFCICRSPGSSAGTWEGQIVLPLNVNITGSTETSTLIALSKYDKI